MPPFVDNLQAEPRQAPEILIEAPNRLTAQRALNLFRACNAIVNGDLLGDLEAARAMPHDPGRPEGLNKYELDAGLRLNIAAHHLGIAARMAIRASHARSFQYAIHKLFLSLQTASVRWTPNVRQPEPCLKVYPYWFGESTVHFIINIKSFVGCGACGYVGEGEHFPASELAGEAQPIGEADRPHIHRLSS